MLIVRERSWGKCFILFDFSLKVSIQETPGNNLKYFCIKVRSRLVSARYRS